VLVALQFSVALTEMGAKRNRNPSSLFSPGHDRLIATLTELREHAGVTQQELAKRMGKHRSFVWKTEGGQRRLDLVEFVRWCRGCGVDPLEVFKRLIPRLGG
jgi:hypothetical protein